MRLDIFNIN